MKKDTVRHFTKYYRPPESYRAKTPEAKANQMRALGTQRGRKKGSKNLSTIKKEQEEALQKASIIEFATSEKYLNLVLHPAQECLLRDLYGMKIVAN